MSSEFVAGAGSSLLADAHEAGREAGLQAAECHGADGARLALAFVPASLDQGRALEGLRSALPGVSIFGSSAFASLGMRGYGTGTVSVVLLGGRFEHASAARRYGADPAETAVEVARECLSRMRGGRFDVAILFCTADRGEGHSVVERVKEVLGYSIILFGGGSGFLPAPDPNHGRTFQYHDGELIESGVGILLLRMDSPALLTATSVRHGMQPICNPVPVTRAEGHWVHELAGESVFEFYQRYLGKTPEDVGEFLRTYPLLVHVPDREETLVRVPIFLDRERCRIGFYPTASMEGRSVSLGHFSRDGLLRACREAAHNAKMALGGRRPRLLLAVSCAARELFLGPRVGDECQSLFEVFGPDVPVAGLYSSAEIAPLTEEGCRPLIAEVGGKGCSHMVAGTFCLLAIGDGSAEASGRRPAAAPLRDAALSSDPASVIARQEVRIRELGEQMRRSEELLEIREQVLLKVNGENIQVSNELRAANLKLSELIQQNLRLQRIVRQYTPLSTWNKAGELALQNKVVIPDESVDLAYLFLDVKGFTSFSETHTPEEVVSSLNVILGPCTDLVYAEGGDVQKYIGDAIFATFPTPLAAVAAALGICGMMREAQTPFQVRIGVHCGRSVHGNVGSERRRDNTHIGDAVNMSQRLESSCAPGGVLLSLDVVQAVEGRLPLHGSRDRVTVKGKREPIEVFAVDVPATLAELEKLASAAKRYSSLAGPAVS